MDTTIALPEHRPYLKPLAVGCYAVIIATGKAGRVGGKARWHGKTVWGIDYASEYPTSELCRITPAEYHAMPATHKISATNQGDTLAA